MRQEAVAQEGRATTARPKPKAPARKRSGAVIVLQVLIVVAVVFAVAYGLWRVTVEQEDTALAVPGQIAGYKLADVYRGEEALAQLTQLHGKDVGLTAGWIGYYKGDAIAYVGAVKDESTAAGLLDAMNKRIRPGTTPFVNLKEIDVDGQTVFTVEGMGQRHYYYQRGKLVIWLTAPKGGEERFLKDALKVIR